ncbi:tetratricopeptide repeat protein [Dokdonella sp.]|uniref:tetratricopeptide repeat protein n=1 Tax=Dokdonella sp. TaxID=2291710 RepID=UPI003C529A05
MSDFFARLKQRKLVQWAVAYLAGAWALLQVLDLAADNYDWPSIIIRVSFALIALGFVVTLVLAWYHGERGEQKVSGAELMILAAVLAVGGGLLWRYAQVESIDPAPGNTVAARAAKNSEAVIETPDKSIAVLPFVNMSSDPDQEYFSDGIAEELLNRLAQLSDLKVAARTSAFQFKGKNEDIGNIGRQLKVAHVLEGSVRKSGTTLRITAQLIDSRTGYHLWSETYDRDASDIFKVQDEIASAIAERLKIELAIDSAATVRSINPKAHEEYLRGRDFLANRRGDLDKAIAAFDRAIAIEPDFSPAYSGKAFAIQLRPVWNMAPANSAVLDETRRIADKALQLDPDNAEAYMVRGMAAFYGWDPAAAGADLNRALALAPGNIDILNMEGDFRNYVGDLAAAEQGKRTAMALDPFSFVHPLNLADVLISQGHYEESIIAAEQAIALGANEYGYDRLTVGYLGSGQIERARVAYEKACELNPDDSSVCGTNEALLLAAEGKDEQATSVVKALAGRLNAKGNFGAYGSESTIAWLYAGLHDFSRATVAQRAAIDLQDWFPTFAIVYALEGATLPEELSTDPQWLEVWNDPRMKAYMDAYRKNLLAWRAGDGKP